MPEICSLQKLSIHSLQYIFQLLSIEYKTTSKNRNKAFINECPKNNHGISRNDSYCQIRVISNHV